MKAVFISDNGRHHRKFTINVWLHLALPLFVLLLVLLLISLPSNVTTSKTVKASQTDIKVLNKFDKLLKKMAILESQTQRLNELGAHIAKRSNVDIKSFNLNKEPARGGLSINDSHESIILTEHDLLKSIEKSEKILAKQKIQFDYYQTLSEIKELEQKYKKSTKNIKQKDTYSSPVNSGYISSSYGKRRDPINGQHRHHRGVDIAGIKGSAINTIASGFVTFVGRKGGYGNVVEIQHTNSLKSRYAHLNTMLVKRGQVVRKGKKIATMGSTGRVTGPHLHLEVWKKDKTINPEKYLDEALSELDKK